ncbi:MAG: nickel-dependent hydrogenase large subunit [Candidatus Bipolaricaulota bacterium]
MTRISIDPITRIEGHLKVELEVEDGVIQSARSSGALYRGLEKILEGRDPLDAQKITQRICGVCPLAHSTAASLCLDDALGIAADVPHNGVLLRNLIYAANFLHNHILHFYHLALPDYIDPSVLAGESEAPLAQLISPGTQAEDRRFTEQENRRLVDNYVAALTMRRKAQEMVALLGGKMPHDMAIVPGGVTFTPGLGELEAFRFRLDEMREFVEGSYIPDVLLWVERYGDHLELGRTAAFLSFGAFPEEGGRVLPAGTLVGGEISEASWGKVAETVDSSWYAEDGEVPALEKSEGYSWVKSPRFAGHPCEVGPAARAQVGLKGGGAELRTMLEDGLREAQVAPEQLGSVAGRHLSRALEVRFLSGRMGAWLSQVDLGGPVACAFDIPERATGKGLTDAPRGALSHWIEIREGKIGCYQVVSPTTWNASPRDREGNPGPLEQALAGTGVHGDGYTEAGRIVRSFDPCLACAVQ